MEGLTTKKRAKRYKDVVLQAAEEKTRYSEIKTPKMVYPSSIYLSKDLQAV
jgi:hypothetical protein